MLKNSVYLSLGLKIVSSLLLKKIVAYAQTKKGKNLKFSESVSLATLVTLYQDFIQGHTAQILNIQDFKFGQTTYI